VAEYSSVQPEAENAFVMNGGCAGLVQGGLLPPRTHFSEGLRNSEGPNDHWYCHIALYWHIAHDVSQAPLKSMPERIGHIPCKNRIWAHIDARRSNQHIFDMYRTC
jgi:hypothetical protein